MVDHAALSGIAGLRFEENWRTPNGGRSFVVPFGTTYPANIVFHGETPFDYEHYGIHLGQEDRLTFLGPEEQEIRGFFIDCRKGSPTYGSRVTHTWAPTSARRLCIPPGIAHAFLNLQNVDTVNTYALLLPPREEIENGTTEWNFESDVINLPLDVTDDVIRPYQPCTERASATFYRMVENLQRENIPKITHSYPAIQDVVIDEKPVRLKIRMELAPGASVPAWEPVEEIEGLGWARHLVVWSGAESGFVPLLDHSPFYVVDHGTEHYAHDAYGIHLGQVDRLTFLGPSDQEVTVTFVDCREGSPTHHAKKTIAFHPSALRYLQIPNGVAHAFDGLENVFTVNRPETRSDDETTYLPGNDIFDWPVSRPDFPTYRVSDKAVSDAFYLAQAEAQQSLTQRPPEVGTPLVVQVTDENGQLRQLRVREGLEAASA